MKLDGLGRLGQLQRPPCGLNRRQCRERSRAFPLRPPCFAHRRGNRLRLGMSGMTHFGNVGRDRRLGFTGRQRHHENPTLTVCPEPGATTIPNEHAILTVVTPAVVGILHSGLLVSVKLVAS